MSEVFEEDKSQLLEIFWEKKEEGTSGEKDIFWKQWLLLVEDQRNQLKTGSEEKGCGIS